MCMSSLYHPMHDMQFAYHKICNVKSLQQKDKSNLNEKKIAARACHFQ